MALSLDYSLTQHPESLLGLVEEKQAAYSYVQQAKADLGFCQLPYQSENEIQKIYALVSSITERFSTILVVGIGGSDLGAKAVHRALQHRYHNRLATPRLFFVGDTSDPEPLKELLEVISLSETAVVVISKSGTTVEQMSVFLYLRQLLLDEVGPEQVRNQIVVITDPEKGALRELVNKEGYQSLSIPTNVGGRFSVLSSAGLFPLTLAGTNSEELLAGARAMDQHDSTAEAGHNLPFMYALQQFSHYPEQSISVLMPYKHHLREFAFWYRQLWAESLGKKDANGQSIGITPIAALGPTDQHSQLQLYLDGPDDKQFTFLTVEESEDLIVPEVHLGSEAIDYLSNKSFNEILQAEYMNTALSLYKAGRSSCTIKLDRLDAYHMGMLLHFFELSVAYLGELLGVNSYDQPGVESSKQYLYTRLGRPGFDKSLSKPENSHILTV